jgi:hypothetical protein
VGLKYASGDSTALMSALSANLSTAKTMLDSTESACDQLVGALGDGQLSGKGYASAKAMFTEAIKPGLADVKGVIDDTQSDLDTYTQADGLVSKYGDLDEDRLRKQLSAVKAQRDLTEQQIEANRSLAAASTTLPGVASSLEIANARLEIVQSGLEDDIREMEDKLKALEAFNAQTAGLFDTWLEEVVEFLGGKPAIGGYVLGAAKGTNSVMRVRDFQDGKGFYRDAEGRVRWRGSGKNPKYLYDRFGSKMNGGRPNHHYQNGKNFNAATGQRIDTYRQSLKAGAKGFASSLADTGRDFTGWKGGSKLTKWGKRLGIAGTVWTVGTNAYAKFHDGVQGNDVRDFAVDAAVDLGSAAAAAGVGAAAGSLFLPPLGTVAGALVGLGFNVAMNVKWPFLGDKSLVDGAKDLIKNGLDLLKSKFW